MNALCRPLAKCAEIKSWLVSDVFIYLRRQSNSWWYVSLNNLVIQVTLHVITQRGNAHIFIQHNHHDVISTGQDSGTRSRVEKKKKKKRREELGKENSKRGHQPHLQEPTMVLGPIDHVHVTIKTNWHWSEPVEVQTLVQHSASHWKSYNAKWTKHLSDFFQRHLIDKHLRGH